jgi:hypothetical protein
MSKAFKKPTVEEVDAYCEERGNNIDAAQFWDFYEMKGWVVGKAPMKDWKAAVRTWERRDNGGGYDNDPFGGPQRAVSPKTRTTLAAREAMSRKMEGER